MARNNRKHFTCDGWRRDFDGRVDTSSLEAGKEIKPRIEFQAAGSDPPAICV